MKASLRIGSVGVSVLVDVVVAQRCKAELIVVLGVIIVGMLRDLDWVVFGVGFGSIVEPFSKVIFFVHLLFNVPEIPFLERYLNINLMNLLFDNNLSLTNLAHFQFHLLYQLVDFRLLLNELMLGGDLFVELVNCSNQGVSLLMELLL
jgi:hypothetical protein